VYRTQASRPCLPAAPFCPTRRVTDAVGGFEHYRDISTAIKGSPLTRMWFALQVCQAEASREGRHLEVNYELATQLCLGDTAREL
jgi:hypothetical protein